ncbi:MAG: ABC transporter substrate-binding protein [Pseudomonadota bacterium]
MRIHLTALAVLLTFSAHAQDCATSERAFSHFGGVTCIPADPQRIVTLQDQNGLLPLMELGVTPVGSLGHVQNDGSRIFRRMDGYDTSEVEWIGSYRNPADAEAVAALAPDLIVGTPFQADEVERLGDLAPVVLIDMFGQPLDDALMQFAALVNRTDRAKELEDAFSAKAAAVRATLGPALAATTVSFITSDLEESRFYPNNPTQAMGMMFRALNPLRPAAEQGLGAEREYRAIETIGAHAADLMLHTVCDADDGGASESHTALLAHPLVQAMPVSQADQIVALDCIAMVGSAWGKAMNGLDQVSEALADPKLNRDLIVE